MNNNISLINSPNIRYNSETDMIEVLYNNQWSESIISAGLKYIRINFSNVYQFSFDSNLPVYINDNIISIPKVNDTINSWSHHLLFLLDEAVNFTFINKIVIHFSVLNLTEYGAFSLSLLDSKETITTNIWHPNLFQQSACKCLIRNVSLNDYTLNIDTTDVVGNKYIHFGCSTGAVLGNGPTDCNNSLNGSFEMIINDFYIHK